MAILWGNHNNQHLMSRVTGTRTEKLTNHLQVAQSPRQEASASHRKEPEQIPEGNEGSHREGDKGEVGGTGCQARHRYL